MLPLTASSSRKKHSLAAIFLLLTILLGLLQAWAYRQNSSSDDLISYLDIGDAYLRGEWRTAINGYWSPLYSWILALSLHILRPSAYWEFFTVKLVNFFIYLLSFFCFTFFLREFILHYLARIHQEPYKHYKIPIRVWLVMGYSLFLLSSLQWIGIYCDTPDMCVAAIVYLATGIVLRLYRSQSSNWLNFIILGVVLGFGYLAKTAMFPLAFVFLLTATFSVGDLRKALLPTLVSLIVFLTISAPLIIAISTTKGHLTFGDSGKLNYAWMVTQEVRPYRFWQGNESGSGIPEHPPRKLFSQPEIFEFRTPVGGTYPPWYDPSYWYEGLIVKFDLEKQINVIKTNIYYYFQSFFGVLIFAYLLTLIGSKFLLSIKALKANSMLLIPAIAGLGIYMIGMDMPKAFIERQPSTRYIAPFIVLLFAGVFASVRLPRLKFKRLVVSITFAALVLISSYQLFNETSVELWSLMEPNQHIQWQVAHSLTQLGVQPGDKVTIMGRYIYPDDHWARLARVKIVTEIMDGCSFWQQTPIVRAKILHDIERTGSKLIVQKPEIKIPSEAIDGWQKLSNTNYYVYFVKGGM